MFFRSEIKKADRLGTDLVPLTVNAADMILGRLHKEHGVGLRRPNDSLEFQIELLVFWIHLIDRIAFASFGADRRDKFIERLIEAAVAQTLQMKHISADCRKRFAIALLNTIDRRQTEYGLYKFLFGKQQDALVGTLFWEFSKVLFACLNDDNQLILISLDCQVLEISQGMLERLKVRKVLGLTVFLPIPSRVESLVGRLASLSGPV